MTIIYIPLSYDDALNDRKFFHTRAIEGFLDKICMKNLCKETTQSNNVANALFQSFCVKQYAIKNLKDVISYCFTTL